MIVRFRFIILFVFYIYNLDDLQSWNEPGFSHRNVEGLCTVGGSTKTDRSDLIGHKGIGFKAVFSVAKKATILSKPKGYYFRLTGDDRRDENLQ